ncbi:LysR family transcriptional regulator [Streptomyces sp. R35]|uniref:LysR family transcriptional regulator n=1 Tax=Streptomyces sp. R35 TaxID=3238630 RepID=A0AB39SJZ7_9ACTN
MQRRSKTVAFIQDGTLLDRERMMDLRQMEAIVAVADMGGFTAAARRLHVVQSAVSSTVRPLERELGTSLFDRTTHRVALTPAGEAFVPPHARHSGPPNWRVRPSTPYRGSYTGG